MLIRLITPEYLTYSGLRASANQQSLTLMCLAALTPPEYDVEIADENISKITYDKKADIVGISFNSATASRAYEIAENYRNLGVSVVLGGFHPSLYPEEALQYADAIVVGDAEHVWEDLLYDITRGKTKRVYKSDMLLDLKKLPIPRYEFYNSIDYYNVFPLFATRGCPYNCTFCYIKSFFGSSFRKRPVKDVVDQIQFIKKECVKDESIPPSLFFVDDNIWGDVGYAKELFKSLIPLNISWSVQGASINLEDELLELAALSGCNLIFVGFESSNIRNLEYLNKNQNKPESYEEFIAKMHKQKIAVGAYFMAGLPYDDQHCFDKLAYFMEKNCVELPMITIYAPKKEEFDKIDCIGKSENKNYASVSEMLPMFTPHNMTRRKFRRGYVDLQRKLFTEESIERRLKNSNQIPCYFINKRYQAHYNAPEWEEWLEK